MKEYTDLLSDLISHESFSGNEDVTARVIINFLNEKGVKTIREKNNVIAYNKHFDKSLQTILLNSHHDTVKPNTGWTLNPFEPIIKDGKLYGLGSNDAGGALVTLIAAFLYFYEKQNLKYNIALAATAEEENSGVNGIELIQDKIQNLAFAIVGEPTEMNMAIAERGLLVVDCIAKGKSGHAAHNTGENAIYKAIKDIEWIKSYKFAKESEPLGEVKMNVTIINAGTQHNVIPDTCKFTVDVRTTEVYTNELVYKIMQQNMHSEIKARSFRLKASAINKEHPLVKAGISAGMKLMSSNTSSDIAQLKVPAVKIGPGSSLRSHTADEFIYVKEIEEGVKGYIKLMEEIMRIEN